MTNLNRRLLLQVGGAALAQALPLAARAQSAAAAPRYAPEQGPWRTFEVTTTVTVPQAKGATQLWLPVPALDTDYQRNAGDSTWTGNAAGASIDTDAKGARMLHAQFAADGAAPTLSLVSRVQTRGRAVDWSKPAQAHEDPAVLKAYLQPTDLQPLDGLVRKTALAATAGAHTDVQKVHALYEWVVGNCYRNPKTPGCGTGNIKAMLESGDMGGKCADLSGLFVSLSRAVGVPAREIYGLRLAPSAFGYQQLGGNSANLTGAQHCRAEVWLQNYGWVAMDPADVLKVERQEKPEWIKDVKNPLITPVYGALFGSWEGNWVGWNTANDVALTGAKGSLPFLMYPQGQDASGRYDELAADRFHYSIAAKELTA